MHMIGHQHPGPNFDTGVLAGLSQQVAIQSVVRLLKERLRATVPALGDVVRQTGNDETS
jgi:hypothetical protein